MKKKVGLILVLFVVSILLISTGIYAFSINDFLNKLSGKAQVQLSPSTTGLIAYYSFDSNSNDQSGYGNNLGCTGVACPTFTNGKISNAYNFDGSDDQYVDSSTVNLDINRFTVSAWIKTSNKQGRKTIVEFTKSSANGNKRRGIALSGNDNLGKPIIYYGNDKLKVANTGDLRDGNWHHIVGVYDGSNALIYVDGVQTSLGAEDITNTGGFPSQLKIGNSLTSNSDNYFSGVIDDVRVYTRALSYSEIQEVYSFGEVTTNATCVDSDGGLNYYVKGTTNAAYPGGGGEVLGDYCNGGVLYESYCGEVEPEALYTQYNCLNGCSNGACLPESNESNITSCVDSDGGNDYYTKGYTSGDLSPFGDGYEGQFGTVYDFCIQLDENGIYPWINESGSGNTWNRYEVAYCEKNCAIYEMSCKNSEIWTNVPTCPSGCSDGACVEKQGVAKYIIEKNISNFVFTHTGFMSDWDLDNCEFFEFEGGIENLPYGDSCINELGDYYYNNIDYLEIVYNNVDILIEVHKIKVSSDNFDNLVKGISNTGYSSLNYESILGNEVVLLTFEDSNSESLTFLWPSNEKIIGISLVDNKYLSDSDLEEFLGAYLTKFPSTLSKIECIPRYYCTVSPTICPSNGVQVKRCEDFECNSGSYEEKVSCNPGQCYGCELDGECIPYGFRTQVTLYNDEPGNYNLYCEINGRLEQQKPSIPGKDWPKCQNSYECESNICSGGECLPVSQAIRDSGKIARFVFSILCKIANPLSDEEYNQCMINFLGE